MAPKYSTGLCAVSKMITKDKKYVMGLESAELNAQKTIWDEEWRQRGVGVSDQVLHQSWAWVIERHCGHGKAEKELCGYEEDGTWFYA